MEEGVRGYIKKKFTVPTIPEWTEDSIGLFIFVEETQTYMFADEFGWVEVKNI